MDINIELKRFPQNQELQTQLETAARRAIQAAFTEFANTEVAGTIDARLATSEDEPEIRKLFEKYPMSLPGFNLVYDRSPDFFSLLRARGEAHVAVTGGLKGSKELLGLGAVSVREGYIAGSRTRVAYLGDLRVIPNRKTFRLWRTIYSRLIEEISRDLGVETFLTAILGDNALALRSLVERRNSDFLYESIGQVRMINLLGSWAPLPESGKIKDAGLQAFWKDESAYRDFSAAQASRMRHGYTQPLESGLPLVIKDRAGDVQLGVRLVSPDSMKRMWLSDASGVMRAVMKLAGVGKESALSTVYMSGLIFRSEASAVQRRLALMAAIEACYSEPIKGLLRKRTMLVVPDSVGLGFRDLRGRVSATTRVQIFEVRSRNFTPSLDPAALINIQNVGFEMALV